MTRHEVRVDSGKYTFVRTAGGGIEILRHGEPWHEQTGASNALASIMAELDAARVVVAAAREAVKTMAALAVGHTFGMGTALAKHDALVDDREPPSAWCGSEPTP